MRSYLNVGVVAVLALLVPVAGCSFSGESEEKAPPLLKEKSISRKGPSTPEQDAILVVIEADKEKFKGGFDGMKPNAPPSAVKKYLAPYIEHLMKVDTTNCPDEFRSAHQRHAKAWQQFGLALDRLPDAYNGTEFMDSLYALFAKNKTRGRALGGDIINAVDRVLATYAEVYAAAANYGLEVKD